MAGCAALLKNAQIGIRNSKDGHGRILLGRIFILDSVVGIVFWIVVRSQYASGIMPMF